MAGLYKWKLSYKVPVARQFYPLLSLGTIIMDARCGRLKRSLCKKFKDKLCTYMVLAQHISSITRVIKRCKSTETALTSVLIGRCTVAD